MNDELKACARCGKGKPIEKSNLSPAQWVECDTCGFEVGPWLETWNEIADLARATPQPRDDEAFDVDKAAHEYGIQFLSSSDGDFPELHDLFVSAIAEGMLVQEKLDRKSVLEAWAKRTGTVECTGEAVPYLKVYFGDKSDMSAFNDLMQEGEAK